MPSDAELLECHADCIEEDGKMVLMTCLKIAVAGSQPWWINDRFVRLVAPIESMGATEDWTLL